MRKRMQYASCERKVSSMTNAVTGKTNFTIKMDRSTREAFGVLCEDIGISMSAAVNALIKQAVRQQGMSFSVLSLDRKSVV